MIVSKHNSLGNNRYFDTASSTSFAFDPETSTASSLQSHTPDSQHTDLAKSIAKSLAPYAKEHYPSAAVAAFPTDSGVAIVLVANKYSLNNFWAGRWRSSYVLDPSSGALKGEIKVDVHYFEDGNVRMQTEKAVDVKSAGSGAAEVVKQIGHIERKYQEELNRGFVALNEGVFKGLRRQLPVTRQRVEWDKVGAYRVRASEAGLHDILTLGSWDKTLAVVGRGELRTSSDRKITSSAFGALDGSIRSAPDLAA